MKNGNSFLPVWLALFTIETSIVVTIIYKAIGNGEKNTVVVTSLHEKLVDPQAIRILEL